MKNIWITQLYGNHPEVTSHKYCKALDNQGKSNTTTDDVIAPFTGKVARIYDTENEVWFQSIDKVEHADGEINYATVMFVHDSDISNLYVGKVIPQGEVFLQEGRRYLRKDQADLHQHFEICSGLTTSWVQAPNGSWSLPNPKDPEKCFFIDDTYYVIKTRGLTFKKVQKEIQRYGTPVETNLNMDQVLITTKILNVRETPNGKLLGYINEGLYNIINKRDKDGYTWYEVEPSKWIAYDKTWAVFYPKQEVITEPRVEEEKPSENSPVEPPKEEEPIVISHEEEKPKDEPIIEPREDKKSVLLELVKKVLEILIKLFKGERK
jgi:hypothetical protein